MPHEVAYVRHNQHPRGDTGSRLSTHEAAAKARAARMDVQVHTWAINELKKYGTNTRDNEAVAATLLGSVRREKLYVPDPANGEFIVSPVCLLGECGGIKFGGGDCDDLAAGYACAVLSVGMPGAAIVGQYFRDGLGRDVLGHVLAAAWTGTKWLYADPSEKFPLGAAAPSSREIWVDVLSGKILCNSDSCDPTSIPEPPAMVGQGDFIGVGTTEANAAICVVDDSFPIGKVVLSLLGGTALGLAAGYALWRR